MRPLLFFLWALLFLGVGGCGSKQNEAETASSPGKKAAASQLPPADVTSTPGSEAAPAPVPAPPVEGLYINPYFDEAGTKTELAVAPGQEFHMYVFAETIDPYSTATVQYRLDLPDGIAITGLEETDQKMMSLGDYHQSYMLAYQCQPPGRFVVVTYTCRVQPDFHGGTITVQPGIPTQGPAFLGFVTCDYVELGATGGSATLDRK